MGVYISFPLDASEREIFKACLARRKFSSKTMRKFVGGGERVRSGGDVQKTAVGSFGSVSVLFVPSFPRLPSWTTEVGKSGGKTRETCNLAFLSLLARTSVGQTEEKTFPYEKLCSNRLYRKFWTVPLSLPLSFFHPLLLSVVPDTL